ncbi:MAG: hypothetical protein V7752_00610 [Halopseudomonas sp.]
MAKSICSDGDINDAAIRILKICRSPYHPESEGTVSQFDVEDIIIYTNLWHYAVSALDLDDDSDLEDIRIVERTKSLLQMIKKWIFRGRDIIRASGIEKTNDWPDSFHLETFISENMDDDFVFQNADLSYYILCLYHLSDYLECYRQSLVEAGPLDDPESAVELYKTIANGRACLMRAQSASEMGRSHAVAMSWGLKLEDEKENINYATSVALLNKEKMDSYNHDKKQRAIDEWVPLIKEVFSVARERSITKNSAASIVAKRYGKTHGTLYNNISKYKEFT